MSMNRPRHLGNNYRKGAILAKSIPSLLTSRPHRAALACSVLAVLALPGTIAAQLLTDPALATPPPNENIPARTEPAVTEPPPPPITQDARAVSPDVRRLHYQLKLDIRSAYDDNIGLSQNNKIGGFYVRIDPAIIISFGDVGSSSANFLRFGYEPDIVFFFDHSEFDAFQNVVHLEGQSNFGRLTLGLSEEAQFLNGTDVNQSTSTGGFVNGVNLDVRGQPNVNFFNTQATGSYDFTGKTSLSGNVQWSVSDYSDFLSSQTVTGNLFVNYAYGPKLNVGVGGSIGREFVDPPTPDQTFEQINVRASYVLTGKLDAGGSVGVEFRQSDAGSGSYVSPVFGLDLTYTPFDGSAFTLSGSRKIASSASLAGQDFTSTQLTASFRQRLLERFFLSLTVGYQNQQYFGASSLSDSNRDDNYYFIQPAIDVKITRFWYVGGYYLHRQNDSSVGNFGFNENQTGIRSTLTF